MAVQLKVAEPGPEPLDTDVEALGALDRGDRRGALTILMRGYGDAVFQFCRRTLRDPALAEDVHQQVFIQAHEDLAGFSRRSSLRTWLFGIAHHRCLDAAKGKRRFLARFASTSDAQVPEVEDPADLPEVSLVRGTLARGLAHCLSLLAPAARTAVTLRYSDGFSYEQMSSICGEKPGTLQARVARAMPVLKKCLEQGGLTP
ncbi:MAG: RNA polymerase sigma factor [Myxococcaceae bacterium]